MAIISTFLPDFTTFFAALDTAIIGENFVWRLAYGFKLRCSLAEYDTLLATSFPFKQLSFNSFIKDMKNSLPNLIWFDLIYPFTTNP